MREIEFLPDWYPRARQRRRLLHVQGYATAVLIGGLAIWMFLAQKGLRSAQAAHDSVASQLGQSKLELKQLDEQLLLKQRLEVQKQIVSKLGLPVEMSRMIAEIDHAMSSETSLIELNIDTSEQQRQASPAKPGLQRDMLTDRKLSVRMLAIAPSDADLVKLLGALTIVPFFEDVHVNFVRDKSDHAHLMREFEVSFDMDLNKSLSD